MHWLLLCAALRSFRQELLQQPKQTETSAEKSEAGIVPEIEADPELALTITAGDSFDMMTDFSGISLKDDETAELMMAAMEDGTEFDVNVPCTYKCVYKVTSKEGDVYLIARYVTVTPRENETTGTDRTSEDSGETQDGGEEDTEAPTDQDAVSIEDQETDNPSETETGSEVVTDSEPESKEETEPDTETETETGVETGTEAESETEAIDETEAATETKTEVETGTGQHGGYQVTIAEEAKYNILLNHEDGRYDAGERVEFSADVPDGSLTAVAALMLPANEAGDMADRLYAEVTYHAALGTYSFLMPEGDISLNVLMDTAEGSPIQPVPDGTGCWKDAVGIKAGTFMYITDEVLDSLVVNANDEKYFRTVYSTEDFNALSEAVAQQTGKALEQGEHLLTLSTCNGNDSKRRLILCRKAAGADEPETAGADPVVQTDTQQRETVAE